MSGLLRCNRRLGLFGALVVIALTIGACGEPEPPGRCRSEWCASKRPKAESERQNGSAEEANGGFTLEVPIGQHLESTEIEVGLQFWLEGIRGSGRRRAAGAGPKHRSECCISPSLDSPTGETFWIHVYTDQSRDDAIDWVRHLASQPPSLARIIVPQHELFDARFREAPIGWRCVGADRVAATVTVEAAGNRPCWSLPRTE